MTIETVVEKKSATRRLIKEPSKYKVIIYNDDHTPVDFVIAMLVMVFKYSESAAHDLTLAVHNKGSAVAGVYTHEVAEQKALDATQMARSNGFPLVLKVEPE